MGRIKSKRRLPVTACNSSQSPILDNTQGAAAAAATTTANCTRKSTQKLISRFHVLNKELARLKSDVDKTTMITSKRIIEIQDEMDSMGGLHAYQKASLKGGNENTGKGYSGKWVAPFLKEIWKTSSTPFFSSSSNIQPQPPKFRLLDVGALNGDTYTAYHNWMCVESIDLNPQNPLKVKRQDFFKRPLPLSVTTTTTTLHQDTFDCIAFSLVINFVGDIVKRGEMIKRALLFLKPSYNPNLSKDKSSTSSSCSSTTGYLYIVLPLPCINNSRYLDHDRFTAMLQHLECHLLQHHFSKKLAFYLFQYQPFDSSATRARLMSEINQEEEQPLPSTTRMAAFPKKQIDPDYLRPAMNNFSIVI